MLLAGGDKRIKPTTLHGLSCESPNRSLSGARAPSFDTVLEVVHALGLRLHAGPE